MFGEAPGLRRKVVRKEKGLCMYRIDRQMRIEEAGKRVIGVPNRRFGFYEWARADDGSIDRGPSVDRARCSSPIGIVMRRPNLAPLSEEKQNSRTQHGGQGLPSHRRDVD